MALLVINIDLTAIKESGKFRKARNGRNYIDLVIQERKEPDTQGNTHAVSISKKKEERENKTIYVGSGKVFGETKPAQEQPKKAKQPEPDDVDF